MRLKIKPATRKPKKSSVGTGSKVNSCTQRRYESTDDSSIIGLGIASAILSGSFDSSSDFSSSSSDSGFDGGGGDFGGGGASGDW